MLRRLVCFAAFAAAMHLLTQLALGFILEKRTRDGTASTEDAAEAATQHSHWKDLWRMNVLTALFGLTLVLRFWRDQRRLMLLRHDYVRGGIGRRRRRRSDGMEVTEAEAAAEAFALASRWGPHRQDLVGQPRSFVPFSGIPRKLVEP